MTVHDQSEDKDQTGRRERRSTAIWLALILLLGLGLRLWGIGWSLPDARHPLATYHPDELVNLSAALQVDVSHGQFDTKFYNYGAFYFYLVSYAQTFGRGWGLIPETPPWPADKPPLSQEEALARQAPENAGLFLAGRLVTVLLGTATVAVVFALGRRLFGLRTGLFAALLSALAPLAAVHAHFLTVDVPATFFVALALLWAARLQMQPTWRDYLLTGVWVGFAAATKYNTGLVLIAPLVAHFLQKPPKAGRQRRLAQLLALLGMTVLTFLIACPGPLLNFDVFWNGMPGWPGSGVRYELFEHARTGHGTLFIQTGPGWWYHLAVSLRFGLGSPLLVLGLFGLGFACIKRTREDWPLLAFFLLYYLACSVSAVRFARYMLPLFPVFCVWAARLVAEPPARQRYAREWAAFGALVALLTLGYTFSLVHNMALPDPRDTAADYLEKNAAPGASVAFSRIPWFFSPPLSPLFGALNAHQRALAAVDTKRFTLRFSNTEWDPSVLSPPPDYVVLSNIETMHDLGRLHLPATEQFARSIPAGYRHIVFAPPATVFNLPSGALVPEDLLYILPRLTLYQKP